MAQVFGNQKMDKVIYRELSYRVMEVVSPLRNQRVSLFLTREESLASTAWILWWITKLSSNSKLSKDWPMYSNNSCTPISEQRIWNWGLGINFGTPRVQSVRIVNWEPIFRFVRFMSFVINKDQQGENGTRKWSNIFLTCYKCVVTTSVLWFGIMPPLIPRLCCGRSC